MTDGTLRMVVVLSIVVIAIAVAYLIDRVRRPPHPSIRTGETSDRPGVVLFTSTECGSCKPAIERLQDLRVPYREITMELEPQRFEDWGVVAVPLTVIVALDGTVIGTFSGVPRRGQLERAIDRAHIERS